MRAPFRSPKGGPKAVPKPDGPYQKLPNERCTVGEAVGIARDIARPATVSARFALWMAFLAMLVASVALTAALAK